MVRLPILRSYSGSKDLLLLVICFLALFSRAQNHYAVRLYNKGVEAYNIKQYSVADSLFALSLQMQVDGDTYFSRALCRGKMADQTGYCMNLANGTALNHAGAKKLFTKHCGRIDTIYKNERGLTVTEDSAIHVIIRYSSGSFDKELDFKYNRYDYPFSLFIPPSTILDSTTQHAEFPGGSVELAQFIQSRLAYPVEAREAGISGKVFTRFVITKTGRIGRIEILKGINGCPACSDEVFKVIRAMPAWVPAKINGLPVHSYFNLPISFGKQ